MPRAFCAWRWDGSQFVSSAGVPVADRGFRYGMAVFETIRLTGGRALFLQEHLQRLRKACATVYFDLKEEALSALPALFATQNELNAMVRLYVTAGEGGPSELALESPLYVLFEQCLAPLEHAYRLQLSTQPYEAPFGGLKTANYWGNAHALQLARRESLDEALLFNFRGELVSACMANVFLVHGTRLRTPPLSSGARDGVVGAWVRQQVFTEEETLSRDDIASADELFLTSSGVGVQPVGEVNGRPLPSCALAERLRTLYREVV